MSKRDPQFDPIADWYENKRKEAERVGRELDIQRKVLERCREESAEWLECRKRIRQLERELEYAQYVGD